MSESVNAVIEDDLVVWSVPKEDLAQALSERALLIVMHGYGSHEHDLISLAPALPSGFVIASLRAPLVAPHPIVNGFSWFVVDDPTAPRAPYANAGAEAILGWLNRIEAKFGAIERVAALGFSQGGAMAIQLLRHAPDRILAAVNLSGMAIDGAAPADAELEMLRPPVFWGFSDNDTIIPQAADAHTAEWLNAHATTTAKMYPGIGHSISAPEIADVSAFLVTTVLEKN